jgi:hypothetical protein
MYTLNIKQLNEFMQKAYSLIMHYEKKNASAIAYPEEVIGSVNPNAKHLFKTVDHFLLKDSDGIDLASYLNLMKLVYTVEKSMHLKENQIEKYDSDNVCVDDGEGYSSMEYWRGFLEGCTSEDESISYDYWDQLVKQMILRNKVFAYIKKNMYLGKTISDMAEEMNQPIEGCQNACDIIKRSYYLSSETDSQDDLHWFDIPKVLKLSELEDLPIFHENELNEQTVLDYFEIDPTTPLYPDMRCSVRKSNFRLQKAEQQSKLKPASTSCIIRFTNEFLGSLGMSHISACRCIDPEHIDYEQIKVSNHLNDCRDIVWMKFTKDGFLGAVAVSNDINFNMEFTSGIIIEHLHKEWDQSFVLIFPLVNIPEQYTRHDIEKGIGNYLIAKGIPILDYYSHNY